MKFFLFLKAGFCVLAIALLIVAAFFLFNNYKTAVSALKSAVVQAPSNPAPIQNELKQDTKENVFDPAVLQWNKLTEQAGWSERDAHTSNAFNGKLWIFGGVGGIAPDYDNIYSDAWSSEDGKNWKLIADKAPWGPRRAHASLVFRDKIWILGGVTTNERYLNDVWYSEDGINWIQVVARAEWSPRKGFGAVVFDDKIWVMGGVSANDLENDVWYSENGKDWFLATRHAGWSPRYDLAAEIFKDKIWLIGGVFPGLMGEKDIWESKDGKNWVNVTKQAVFPGRHGHCLIFYNDYIWVIGGWSGYGHGYNDVWYSKDGASWEQLYKDGKDGSPWKGREDLACAEFEDKLFIMGGMKSIGERTNDVWQLGSK